MPAPSPSGPDFRPNPEPFSGSLVWWVEVPAHEQFYLQGVLEGYEGLGYYQTLLPRLGEDGERASTALGRITSVPDARGELASLLAALGEECGLRLPERAPDIPPDFQPAKART